MAGGNIPSVRTSFGEKRWLKALSKSVYNELVAEEKGDMLSTYRTWLHAAVWLVGLALVAAAYQLLPKAARIGSVAVVFVLWIVAYYLVATALRRGSRALLRFRMAYLSGGPERPTPPQRDLTKAVNDQIQRFPEKVVVALDHRVKRSSLPEIGAALSDLRTAKNRQGALVLRGYLERKPWPLYLRDIFSGRATFPDDKQNYWLAARGHRNAIKIGLLFRELGVMLRDEIKGQDNWRRDYRSEPGGQIVALYDSRDIPLRFRTVAPHMNWPNAAALSSKSETAWYRAITCAANPSQIPLYVLPLESVLDKLDEAIKYVNEALLSRADARDFVLERLTTIPVDVFDKMDRRSLQRTKGADLGVNFSVLKKVEELYGASETLYGIHWDANRIVWDEVTKSGVDNERALPILQNAIDLAAGDAIAVYLRRGDCLIVDNLRCLVGRHERDATQMAKWKHRLGFPQAWWMRGFYGFRFSDEDREDAGRH